MLIGAHVPAADPFGGAGEVGADVIQLHLSAPRAWRAPKRRQDAEALRDAAVVAGVHAPYLCNPASANEQVRERTARVLQQTLDEAGRVGAAGVIVHAGHAAGGGDLDDAVERWLEVARTLRSDVPLLVENMATGAVSPGRHLADLERLFAALHGAGLDVPIAGCLDTCHAFAGDADAAADPVGWVERFAAAAGNLALVHVNDSEVGAGAGRDRHTNLGAGEMGLDLLGTMVRTAARLGAPAAVIETPSDDGGHVRDLLTLRGLLEPSAAA